jgi:hypothetical protein
MAKYEGRGKGWVMKRENETQLCFQLLKRQEPTLGLHTRVVYPRLYVCQHSRLVWQAWNVLVRQVPVLQQNQIVLLGLRQSTVRKANVRAKHRQVYWYDEDIIILKTHLKQSTYYFPRLLVTLKTWNYRSGAQRLLTTWRSVCVCVCVCVCTHREGAFIACVMGRSDFIITCNG